MNPPDDRASEVLDFKEILSNPIDGQIPLLVGGHAVNLWALSYQKRIGREMDEWLPLTSKDLDLFGTLSLLEAMKTRFGGNYRLSGPRSPVVGQLLVNLVGVERQIDVLREVYGLRRQELEEKLSFSKSMSMVSATRSASCPRFLCYRPKSPTLPISTKRIATTSSM